MADLDPHVHGIPAYRMSISWALNQPGQVSYTVYGPDAAQLHAGEVPIVPTGVLDLSLDGSGIDTRMLTTGAQLVYDQPGYVTESGSCLGLALEHTPIARFTAQQILLADAFTAEANTIGIVTAPTHVITPILPDQMGIGRTPGVITWTFVVDPAISQQPLDLDINEDNMLHATQMIMQHAGSFVDPQQTQFYIDPGDLGPHGARAVVIGARGEHSVTFDGDTIPILRMTTSQAQTTDMCASCTFKGGDSHHGLPTSGRITGMDRLSDGMPVLAVYASTGVGGVYFWPGDGSIYPMSQAMGVNAIWSDQTTNHLYAATDAGVYSKSIEVLADLAAPAVRVGRNALKCLKVQVEATFVYALAEFAGAAGRNVLQFVVGQDDHVGYPDWPSLLAQAGIADFAVLGDYCFSLLANFPGQIQVYQISTKALLPAIDVPGSASVVGLDPISPDGNTATGIFVRTDQGSSALFYLNASEPRKLVAANIDLLLKDDYGAPVMVNSVKPNTGGSLACSTADVPANLLAATSLGVWYCADTTGRTGWMRTDGQSSIGDFNTTCVAAGTRGTSDQRTLRSVYACADTAFYYSNNGGVNWIDAFSEPLDAGPYFYNYFRKGYERWPTLDDTQIPVGNAGYLLVRQLNGISQFNYVLVNPTSQAPAGQHRSAELSQLSSPANMSEITVSRLLVFAMVRFLAYTAKPQVIVEVESYFDDTGSALRTLRPTDQVTLSGAPMDYVIAPGLAPFALGTWSGSYYVLSHQIDYDRDQDPTGCTTRTRLGSLLLDDRSDPLKVTADIWYQVSRSQLYRTRSRR
jgi:hypothetical protein